MSQVIDAITGATRFTLNKIKYNELFAPEAETELCFSKIDTLSYFTAKDENGIIRGGNLPWSHLIDIIPSHLTSKKEKVDFICAVLAKLPSNVAFNFITNPRIKDADIVIDAFKKAGFIHNTRNTNTFYADTDQDLIKRLKSDARTKVNASIRDMELVPMSVEEFFAYYSENLKNAEKSYYFNFDIDVELFKRSMTMTSAKVHILAARQKASDKTPENAPIDAAFFCGTGDDGFLKLMRITYRLPQADDVVAPHKHAIKFLVFEAMRMAAINGLTLDTDGYTPGGDVLYSRFGVFNTEVRHEFSRKTAQTLLKKLFK